MNKPLLTVKDLSSLIKMHPQTIYSLVRNKKISFVRLNSTCIRFRINDIDEYIEKNTRKSFSIPSYPQNCTNQPLKHNNYGGIYEVAKAKSKTRYNFGYGAIYQRKTKGGKIRWYLDYRDGDGKRIQKVAPLASSKEEAAFALREEVAKAFNKEYSVERKREKVKFKEFSEIYLKNYAKVKKRSWKSDYYYLHANLIPYFGDSELFEIGIFQIERYISKRLKDGVTKSTINRELACLRKMFNKAIDWDYLSKNPVSKVNFFSEKDNLKERVLTQEEEKKLLRTCSEYLRPIIITAIHVGLRRGEIFNLKWENVNFSKKEIKVEKTKSGKVRLVPINDFLLRELSRLEEKNGESKIVFFNPETGKPYRDIKKAFKGACRKAGIRNLRFQDLRHTFASRLVERGIDLITVKDLLGHSSVKITERYTHSNKIIKKAAVEVLVQKREEKSQKRENLLHICDLEKYQPVKKEKEKVLIHSFSVN